MSLFYSYFFSFLSFILLFRHLLLVVCFCCLYKSLISMRRSWKTIQWDVCVLTDMVGKHCINIPCWWSYIFHCLVRIPHVKFSSRNLQSSPFHWIVGIEFLLLLCGIQINHAHHRFIQKLQTNLRQLLIVSGKS